MLRSRLAALRHYLYNFRTLPAAERPFHHAFEILQYVR